MTREQITELLTRTHGATLAGRAANLYLLARSFGRVKGDSFKVSTYCILSSGTVWIETYASGETWFNAPHLGIQVKIQ